MKITNNKNFYTNANEFFNNLENSNLTNLQYFNAKVIKSIKDKLPGTIEFRMLNQDNSSILNNENLFVAYPLNPNNYTIPVPNQIIKLIEIQGIYYYFGINQITANENGDFVFDYANNDQLGTNNKINSDDYKQIFSGNKSPNQQGNYDLEDFIKKENKIPPIKEKVGDTILKGMQNNNIILSYDKNGNPFISFVINREDENFNENSNNISIYSNLDIDSNFNYAADKKTNIPNNEKKGTLGLINLDKLRINAKNGSIILSANNSFTVTTNNNVNIDNKTKVNINSPEIYLGENAKEPLVLGNELTSLLEKLIDEINKLTVLTPQGPSSTPVNKPQFSIIKQKIKKILSRQNKTK
jgi:hypothetical protein